MQCHRYLPMYHAHYDHIADTNGGSMHSSNGTFENAYYNTYAPSIPAPQANFSYKELLRRTILIQEYTFKDQVQELHRLYRRQREMMSEIKTEVLCLNSLQLEVQSSNFPSADLSKCSQSNLQNFHISNSLKRPCLVDADDIQGALSCINELNKSDSCSASHDGITSQKYPESKGKVIAGKLLDLELPADVYIDSDEWEALGAAQCGEIPSSISLPPNKPGVFVGEDVASEADGLLGSFLLKGFPPCSFQQTNSNLTDLNEPPTTFKLERTDIVTENEIISEISEKNAVPFCSRSSPSNDTAHEESQKPLALPSYTKHEMHIGSGKKPLCNLRTKPSIVQALPSVNNQSRSRKCALRSKGSVKAKFEARSNSNVGRPKSSQRCSESKLGTVAHFSTIRCFDLNSACEFILEDTSSVKAFNEEVDEGNFPRKDIVTSKQNGVDSSISLNATTTRKNKRGRVIDINMSCDSNVDEEFLEDYLVGHKNIHTCVTDNRSLSLSRNASEIDLEVPVGLELEACPPPRGYSAEIGSVSEVTILEGDYSLRKLAAEVIVSISSSKSPFLLERKGWQDFPGTTESGYLEWFAGLAYSLSKELDNDLTMVRYENTDDFEALTLKSTEMKVEERWSRNFIDISNQNRSVSLGGRTRKGRMKRSKRKDFQRVVLPSLSSLSRYEVTEDFQMIEGLMEAAGTPWETKTKRTCKVMVKKTWTSKRLMTATVVPVTFPMRWGKDNQRPRAWRRPASPSAVMSKWIHFSSLVGRPQPNC